MNIGQAIKAIRKQKKLTQVELADASGITQTALSQLESGRKRPGPGTLQKLCGALEIPELLIYLLAMEEVDIPAGKKDMYKLLYPSIRGLALQLVGRAEDEVFE